MNPVLRSLAPLLLMAGLFACTQKAEAAIFRLSDSSWVANPADRNESGAAYTGNSGTLSIGISGDFHINTKYLDSNGTTVTPSNYGAITAWDIRVTGDTTDSFGTGTGSATYTEGSKTLVFANGANTLTFTFTNNLLDQLGNTINASGTSGGDNLWSEAFATTSYTPVGTLTPTAAGAQADFIPLSPSFLFIMPVLRSFAAFRKRLVVSP